MQVDLFEGEYCELDFTKEINTSLFKCELQIEECEVLVKIKEGFLMYAIKKVVCILVLLTFVCALSLSTFAYAYVKLYPHHDNWDSSYRNPAIQKAVDKWNAVAPDYFRFQYFGNTPSAIGVGDNCTTVWYANFADPNASGKLPTQVADVTKDAGYSYKGDVFVNTNAVRSTSCGGNGYYMIVLHELGHIIGLGDTSSVSYTIGTLKYNNECMFGSAIPLLPAISPNDIAAIKTKYQSYKGSSAQLLSSTSTSVQAPGRCGG